MKEARVNDTVISISCYQARWSSGHDPTRLCVSLHDKFMEGEELQRPGLKSEADEEVEVPQMAT